MAWRDQLALLLGAASPFGLVATDGQAAEPIRWLDGPRADPPEVQKDLLLFRDPAERERLLLFAGHRSHSSHSSHRSHYSSSGGGHSSHSSHYSGSGGYATPAPVYRAPAVSAPRPKPAKPKPAPTYQAPVSDLSEDERAYLAAQGSDPAPRLKAAEIKAMVQKVQVALVVRGYDPGPVDGKLGQKTKIALGRFQAASGLPISGAMDLETLQRLGVEVAMSSRPGEELVSSEPPRADVITRPDWARKPSGEDMARYYPDRAQRMEVSGRATISCTVTEQGTLENCTVVSESPADMGFGDAAIRLSRLFLMKPRTLDGSPVAGGQVTVPLVFQVPQ